MDGEMKPKKKGLPANYGGATPRQVAEAVLRYRPGKKTAEQEVKQARKEKR